MASIAFKIFIRASKIDMFHSPIFIYEFNAARWSNFKRRTVIFPCINHSLIANAIWDSGTKQEICFQVLLSLSHCDHSLCLLCSSIPCLHHRQEAECAKEEQWFVSVLWNLDLLLPHGPNTECTVRAQVLQHELFEALCQLSLWYPNKTELFGALIFQDEGVYAIAVCVMPELYFARLLFYFFSIQCTFYWCWWQVSHLEMLGGGTVYCDNSILYVKSDNEDFVDMALHYLIDLMSMPWAALRLWT